MSTMTMPGWISPDDLLLMPEGEQYELIDGRPVEKSMGAKSEEIAGLLLTALNVFIRPRRLGRAYVQAGYRCFPANPDTLRKPDVSFVAAGRLPNNVSPDGFITVTPDFAAEVVSPTDLYENVEAKVRMYRSAGVKLVWVISPTSRTVLIRRLDGTCGEVDEAGQLSGENVIPGFTCPVADLFQ